MWRRRQPIASAHFNNNRDACRDDKRLVECNGQKHIEEIGKNVERGARGVERAKAYTQPKIHSDRLSQVARHVDEINVNEQRDRGDACDENRGPVDGGWRWCRRGRRRHAICCVHRVSGERRGGSSSGRRRRYDDEGGGDGLVEVDGGDCSSNPMMLKWSVGCK